MRYFFFLCIIILSISSIQGQKLSSVDYANLEVMEKNMIPFSQSMIEDTTTFMERFRADSFFTRILVKALKVPYSFYYPFNNIHSISVLTAPDSTFKIFTWQVMRDINYYRQHGAIQMNTSDGSLRLFPLFDCSDFTDNPIDSIRTPKNWIGAVYYRMVTKTFNNKNYYTLLGIDGNTEVTNKKWIEVLSFDEADNPRFGGRYFQYPADSLKPKQPAYRYFLEYKKDAIAKLNYDPIKELLLFERLVPETKGDAKTNILIPYGELEAFRWQSGAWRYVMEPLIDEQPRDIKQSKLPSPILDSRGNRNEKLLIEQSEKNRIKGQTIPSTSVVPPNKIDNKNKAYKPGEQSND